MFIVKMDKDSNETTQINMNMDMNNLAGFMCYLSKVIKIVFSLLFLLVFIILIRKLSP